MAGRRRRRGADDDGRLLDMTSMIDVVFLLLVFFMCATKFRLPEGSLQTHLPRDQGGRSVRQTPETERGRVHVLRRADGGVLVALDEAHNVAPDRGARDEYELARGLPPGPDVAYVQDYVQKRQAIKPGLSLVVDFSDDVPWKYVVDIVNVSKALKIEDVAFARREIADE